MLPMSEGEKTTYVGIAGQFKAAIDAQGSPWNFFIKTGPEDQVMFLTQDSEQNWVVFPSSTVMRQVADLLLEQATKWDNGELPKMKGKDDVPA